MEAIKYIDLMFGIIYWQIKVFSIVLNKGNKLIFEVYKFNDLSVMSMDLR